ncbi:hypothetical protein I553_8003 [Mycobacterium xenopi 4042]|uniref:Uncharacterized protein n=1 Tax=Mycobacterium xenopi 4042 TaxID=1299334 RepID=X8DAD5_MYCXE|nr:hypothetical protein I553_8003 [Mycobacterium xenopi 4042]
MRRPPPLAARSTNRPLYLEDKPLNPERGQNHICSPDLKIDICQRPVQDRSEQILKNVLRNFLSRRTEQALLESLAPTAANPGQVALIRSTHLRYAASCL